MLWRAEVDAAVVAVRAGPAEPDDPDAFPLKTFETASTLARGEGGQEYLVLSDGWRRLRLDVIEGTLGGEDFVRFDYRLSGFHDLEPRLRTLHRLAGLRRDGRFDPRLFPPPAALPRRIEALRVADGLRAGASYRDIAEAMFGEARVRADWRTRSDYLLSRIRRRAGEARQMLAGGYRVLFGRSGRTAACNGPGSDAS